MKTTAATTAAKVEKLSASYGLSKLELMRVVGMTEAARLSSLSPDTLRRRYSHLLIKLTAHRDGMRVVDALTLGQNST